MKALMLRELGGPLALEDVPSPEPGPGQVRIDVEAAAVNFPDVLMLEGKYQFKPALPFAPGCELSGVVSAVGPGTEGFAPGDRVLAVVRHGAFAEEALADVERVVRIPDPVAFDRAAAFMFTYGTSYHALKDRAALQPGETLLVLGAAGGVGLAAVELGKRMGARVIAAASTAEKLEACRARGADDTIRYGAEDLRERVKDLTGGRGVDVVCDPVGGPYTEPAVRSLAWRGRLLVVGFAHGEIPRVPLNLALLKGASIVGVFWGDFTRREPELNRANMAQLVGWLARGELDPYIGSRHALRDGARALAEVRERRARGKVLVLPR
ncbi:MAG TPA: NADPH:quinone oxidoreductase family protein [Usitatibacter sp.]|nr:NADPH:quinone oxidoreductase family protein [Usitatibacter sp.]